MGGRRGEWGGGMAYERDSADKHRTGKGCKVVHTWKIYDMMYSVQYCSSTAAVMSLWFRRGRGRYLPPRHKKRELCLGLAKVGVSDICLLSAVPPSCRHFLLPWRASNLPLDFAGFLFYRWEIPLVWNCLFLFLNPLLLVHHAHAATGEVLSRREKSRVCWLIYCGMVSLAHFP